MPLDDTDYQPEQSLELRALRHALAFFTGPEKWSRGKAHRLDGSKCIGTVMKEVIRDNTGWFAGPRIQHALGVRNPPHWNDGLSDFATLIGHLKTRIAFYESQRLSYAKASVEVAA